MVQEILKDERKVKERHIRNFTRELNFDKEQLLAYEEILKYRDRELAEYVLDIKKLQGKYEGGGGGARKETNSEDGGRKETDGEDGRSKITDRDGGERKETSGEDGGSKVTDGEDGGSKTTDREGGGRKETNSEDGGRKETDGEDGGSKTTDREGGEKVEREKRRLRLETERYIRESYKEVNKYLCLEERPLLFKQLLIINIMHYKSACLINMLAFINGMDVNTFMRYLYKMYFENTKVIDVLEACELFCTPIIVINNALKWFVQKGYLTSAGKWKRNPSISHERNKAELQDAFRKFVEDNPNGLYGCIVYFHDQAHAVVLERKDGKGHLHDPSSDDGTWRQWEADLDDIGKVEFYVCRKLQDP